jgi:hypothetical protein
VARLVFMAAVVVVLVELAILDQTAVRALRARSSSPTPRVQATSLLSFKDTKVGNYDFRQVNQSGLRRKSKFFVVQ